MTSTTINSTSVNPLRVFFSQFHQCKSFAGIFLFLLHFISTFLLRFS